MGFKWRLLAETVTFLEDCQSFQAAHNFMKSIENPASLKPVRQNSLRSQYSARLRRKTWAATGGTLAQNSQCRTQGADDLGLASWIEALVDGNGNGQQVSWCEVMPYFKTAGAALECSIACFRHLSTPCCPFFQVELCLSVSLLQAAGTRLAVPGC